MSSSASTYDSDPHQVRSVGARGGAERRARAEEAARRSATSDGVRRPSLEFRAVVLDQGSGKPASTNVQRDGAAGAVGRLASARSIDDPGSPSARHHEQRGRRSSRRKMRRTSVRADSRCRRVRGSEIPYAALRLARNSPMRSSALRMFSVELA